MAGEFVGIIDIDAAITAAADIWELATGAANMAQVMSWTLGQRTELGEAQEEHLTLSMVRYSGSPTSGSGGSAAATLKSLNAQGVASVTTIEVGNTTPASGGTAEEVWREDWMIRQPFLYLPPPNEIITIGVSQRLVLRVIDAPTDSIGGTNGIQGSVRVYEIG